MRNTITQSVAAKSFIPTPYTTVGQMKQGINNWLSGKNISSHTIESVIFSDGSILTPVVLSTNTYDNVNFLGQEKILQGAQIVVNVTISEPTDNTYQEELAKEESIRKFRNFMSIPNMIKLKGNNSWKQFDHDVLNSYKLATNRNGKYFVTNMFEEIDYGDTIEDINLNILEKGNGKYIYTFYPNSSVDKFPYFTNKSKAIKYWKIKYFTSLGRLGDKFKLKDYIFIESTKQFQPYGYVKSDVQL